MHTILSIALTANFGRRIEFGFASSSSQTIRGGAMEVFEAIGSGQTYYSFGSGTHLGPHAARSAE